ncbi:hypothetical protein [Onishia taeanensis]|uniref:Uncharacterized protein n=1 Tax=Onishia taeanensis TaxID=284577 RepID=A0A328XTI9_9GAMM|nr:hypothetical protein [Halomonas taeanensis]RAR62122.1 hypothetical protein BCL93_10498 [Halomonas taeanensis]
MDARQYLAKKGIDLDKEEEKPHTLEELAWSRAIEAGQHRPRSGTPHDWEDWSRYHESLADGAERLEQKIDPKAHGGRVSACDNQSKPSGDHGDEKAGSGRQAGEGKGDEPRSGEKGNS